MQLTKRSLLYWLLMSFALAVHSQQQTASILRLYADNDALVPSHKATDWGYTSGIRIDLFQASPVTRGFHQFFYRNKHSEFITTTGWGILQIIYAPDKTRLTIPDKNDYPYSGALVAIHSCQAVNTVKKYKITTEYLAGMMGPPSLAEVTHKFFHRLIQDPAPMGWGYQLPTDLLLNCNIKAEKELTRLPSMQISLLGTAELRAGTMNDDAAAGLRLQTGNKFLFSGFSRDYFGDKKPRLTTSVEAKARLNAYNALLQGGLFNRHSPVHDKMTAVGTNRKLQRVNVEAEWMVLIGFRKVTVTGSQQYFSSDLKGYGQHFVGNISLYIYL